MSTPTEGVGERAFLERIGVPMILGVLRSPPGWMNLPPIVML